jgi:hypothetical protein
MLRRGSVFGGIAVRFMGGDPISFFGGNFELVTSRLLDFMTSFECEFIGFEVFFTADSTSGLAGISGSVTLE